LLAIDKENHHYMLPDRDELRPCVRDATTYTCDQKRPYLLRGSGTLRGPNIYESARTDPKLRKGTNTIRNHFVDNIDSRAIVALLNSKSVRNYDKM